MSKAHLLLCLSSKEICWKSNHSRALTSYTVLIVCFLRCCWVTWRCYSTNLLPHECWFHIVARVAWRMSATKTWFWWGRWPWAWAAQKNQKQLQYSWKRSVDVIWVWLPLSMQTIFSKERFACIMMELSMKQTQQLMWCRIVIHQWSSGTNRCNGNEVLLALRLLHTTSYKDGEMVLFALQPLHTNSTKLSLL